MMKIRNPFANSNNSPAFIIKNLSNAIKSQNPNETGQALLEFLLPFYAIPNIDSRMPRSVEWSKEYLQKDFGLEGRESGINNVRELIRICNSKCGDYVWGFLSKSEGDRLLLNGKDKAIRYLGDFKGGFQRYTKFYKKFLDDESRISIAPNKN